jgi:hypothetical protein
MATLSRGDLRSRLRPSAPIAGGASRRARAAYRPEAAVLVAAGSGNPGKQLDPLAHVARPPHVKAAGAHAVNDFSASIRWARLTRGSMLAGAGSIRALALSGYSLRTEPEPSTE